MRLRVIDYVANLGGGVRYAAETIKALLLDARIQVDLVSFGHGLRTYKRLLGDVNGLRFLEIVPANVWRNHAVPALLPGRSLVRRLLGLECGYFEVSREAFAGCDWAWFPWLPNHRIPGEQAAKTVGTLHDVIAIDFPDPSLDEYRAVHRRTLETWLSSSAQLVVTSAATMNALCRLFGTKASRVRLVRTSTARSSEPGRVVSPYAALGKEGYLLCPANVTPHKNHEVLLAGFAASDVRHPLVLTGGGTQLWQGLLGRDSRSRRRELRRLARRLGLERGRSLFALGYVTDRSYRALLENARALVMPTLAEGGGSYPVLDALIAGIPVVASDIPVLQEMMTEVGGEVLWFDPYRADDLCAKLKQLEAGYSARKAAAVEQAPRLRLRTWRDVAGDYSKAFNLYPLP